MEVENVNVKNWKSLIKPSKLDVQISDDLTHAKIAGGFNAPLNKFAYALKGLTNKTSFALQALIEKKESGEEISKEEE
jgi:hypothetical protein